MKGKRRPAQDLTLIQFSIAMAVFDTLKILTGQPKENFFYIYIKICKYNLHTNNETESLLSLHQSKNGQKGGFCGPSTKIY